jgi:hypothetical protein
VTFVKKLYSITFTFVILLFSLAACTSPEKSSDNYDSTNLSESINSTPNAVNQTQSNVSNTTSAYTSEVSTTSITQNSTTRESMQSRISKSPFIDISIESVNALEQESKQLDGKTVYLDNFKTVKTLTDATTIQSFLNTLNNEEWKITPAGQWSKLNPVRANRYAIVISCKNGRQLAINLHYTSSQTTCYIAVAEFSSDITYDEYVKQNINKDVFDRYIITKEAGQTLLNIFES